jgi:hypothetical protein
MTAYINMPKYRRACFSEGRSQSRIANRRKNCIVSLSVNAIKASGMLANNSQNGCLLHQRGAKITYWCGQMSRNGAMRQAKARQHWI